MKLLIYMIIVTGAYVVEKEVIIKKTSKSFRFILQSIQMLYFFAIVIAIKFPCMNMLLHNVMTEISLTFLLVPAAWYPIQYFKSHSIFQQVHVKSIKNNNLKHQTIEIKSRHNTTVSLVDNSTTNSNNIAYSHNLYSSRNGVNSK